MLYRKVVNGSFSIMLRTTILSPLSNIAIIILLFSTTLPKVVPVSPSTISNVFHLKAPTIHAGARLKFGQSVCISRSGTRIIIGANAYTGFKGAAYVYDLVQEPGTKMEDWRRTLLVGSDSEPAEEKHAGELRVVGRGSAFGFSCMMDDSGNFVGIGAPGHDKQRGRVYFYGYVGEERRWEEVGKLDGLESRSGDLFGWGLSCDKFGELLVVAAKGRRANNGEVFVFKCGRGFKDCVLSCRIVAPDYTDEAGPRGIRIRNNFGVSLALNRDGNTLAIGSTGYKGERGAVYVFVRQDVGGNFTFLQRLVSLNGQEAGFFGYKIGMDESGCSIAVGADGEEKYRGAVYTFHRHNCSMVKSMYEDEREVILSSSMVEDNFGGSVTMSGDGRNLLVGAPGANRGRSKDHGMVHIYESSGEDWEYVESIELGDEHSRTGSFFGWATGSSYDSKRFVMSAPNAYNEMGMVVIAGYKTDGKKKADSRSIANDDVTSVRHDEL